MGGPGVYKPEFPTLPGELQRARGSVWDTIAGQMNQPGPSYQAAGGQLYAPPTQYQTNAGAQLDWLLGGQGGVNPAGYNWGGNTGYYGGGYGGYGGGGYGGGGGMTTRNIYGNAPVPPPPNMPGNPPPNRPDPGWQGGAYTPQPGDTTFEPYNKDYGRSWSAGGGGGVQQMTQPHEIAQMSAGGGQPPPGSYVAFDPTDPNAANIGQEWWRSPGTGGYAGNVVWNPQFGWQDQSAVKNWYQSQPGRVTDEQFARAPFQAQMGDWSQYYPENRYTAGGSYTDPSTGYTYSVPGDVYGGGGTGGGSYGSSGGGGPIQAPQIYGTPPGYGTPTATPGQMPMPSILGNTQGTLEGMMATGNPVNMNPVYQAMMAQAQQNMGTQMDQAMQAMNLNNTRYGTMSAQRGGQIARQGITDLNAQFAPMQAQALENAAGRQMQGAQLGMQLGQLQNQIPLDRIMMANQMGNNQQQMAQGQNQLGYQDWMSRLAENRPYWQNAFQYAMGYPAGASAPQVTAPWWAQALGGVGNLLGGWGQMG